uniref:MAM domain-containing protein n=1 Tax=Romanomermis culicivorax TaxID=13658 RepID=A0A915HTX5_ROMCU
RGTSSAGTSSSVPTASTRTVASSTAAAVSLTTPPRRMFENPCEALNCSFEKDMCNYYNSPRQMTAWKRVHKNIDTEQLSDIWTNDKYFLSTKIDQNSTAGASGKKDPAVAVLGSQHFNLKPGVEYILKLDYFAKGNIQSRAENGVRICFVQSGGDPAKDYENRRCSRLNTTLTNQSESGYEGWKHLAIPLGGKVYRIYFITIKQNLPTNVTYGIDNIALEGCP